MLLRRDDFQLDDKHAFGTLLTTLRISAKKKITQANVVAYLPGWTISSYSRLENGDIAPRFDQLPELYRALQQAGITFSLHARMEFVDLACKRIAIQRTYKDVRTDAEWAQLRFELARLDGLPDLSPDHAVLSSRPLLAETSHLVGRERSREELVGLLREKKMLVIRGPAGIGKSSELNWLATYLFRQESSPYRVLLCDLRSDEQSRSPEEALDIMLGTVLTELRSPHPQSTDTSVEERTLFLLDQLEQLATSVVVLIDHGECLLRDNGSLAVCWERFLSLFLRSQHRAKLVLATKQWPGWYGGEHRFVAEYPLLPLSPDEGGFSSSSSD
jgi:transcriptional regulator with XRE-family HTH domain